MAEQRAPTFDEATKTGAGTDNKIDPGSSKENSQKPERNDIDPASDESSKTLDT